MLCEVYQYLHPRIAEMRTTSAEKARRKVGAGRLVIRSQMSRLASELACDRLHETSRQRITAFLTGDDHEGDGLHTTPGLFAVICRVISKATSSASLADSPLT